MAKNKTTENENSVTDYLNSIADNKRRADSAAIVQILEEETGMPPKMWGTGIVGFGSYHYKYNSGLPISLRGYFPLVNPIVRKDHPKYLHLFGWLMHGIFWNLPK